MSDELLDLDANVKSVIYWLDRALGRACEMVTDQETRKPVNWSEMRDVVGRLHSARLVLGEALSPVRQAVAAERERHDDDADRAEALRG